MNKNKNNFPAVQVNYCPNYTCSLKVTFKNRKNALCILVK